jgi:protein TonB
VQVRADGSIGAVTVEQSSGFARLDEAAVEAARRSSFAPAIRGGRPVAENHRIEFTFRLVENER